MKTKNILSILILGFLILPLSQSNAEYTGVCIQKTQAAISTEGECKLFSNPCIVPNEWKHISSCDNFGKEIEGKDINETNKRRFNISKWRNKKKINVDEEKKKIRKRIITGGTWNRISAKKADLTKKKHNRRTFSRKKYFSKKLFEDRKEKTTTPYQRTNRKRIARASGPENRGVLSTSKWSNNKNNHFRKKDYSKRPAWKSAATLRNEARASNKKDYTQRSATLRRRWSGKRLEGSLD